MKNHSEKNFYQTLLIEGDWAGRFVRLRLISSRFLFSFFFPFFLPAFVDFWETNFTVINSKFTVYMHCADTVHILKNIKNGSHSTIYTFKNYFATVFSVFSFQFSVSAIISSIQTDP